MIAKNNDRTKRRQRGNEKKKLIASVKITKPNVIPLTHAVLEELGADVGDSIEFGLMPGKEKLCMRKYEANRVGGPEFESLGIVPIQFEPDNEGDSDGEA